MVVSEHQVGIRCYLPTKEAALLARVKASADDFQVVELTPTGPVPEIGGEALVGPTPIYAAPPAKESCQVTKRAKSWHFELAINLLSSDGLPESPVPELVAALGQEAVESLWRWLREHPGRAVLDAPPHLLVAQPPVDKEARSVVHLALISLCPALLTKVVDGQIWCEARPVSRELLPLLGESDSHRLCHFAACKPEHPLTAVLQLDVAGRGVRTQLHQLLRREPSLKHLQTDSARPGGGGGDGGAGCGVGGVVVRWRAEKRKGRDSESGGARRSQLRFVAEKAGLETHQAVRLMARAWRVPPSAFSFAGTKDATARTRQRMCVADVSAETVVTSASALESQGIRLGHLSYADGPIRLGDLEGNAFSITLRDVRLATEGSGVVPIEPARSVEEGAEGGAEGRAEAALRLAVQGLDGFVNYFGLQRFGANAHEVGRHVLRGDHAAAVDAIVAGDASAADREAEAADGVAAVRAHWRRTRDAGATARLAATLGGEVRRRLADELALLRGYERGGCAESAFASLTFQKRSLYVQAYVSALWNDLASLRLELGGAAQAFEGDALLTTDTDGAADAEDETSDADVAATTATHDTAGEATRPSVRFARGGEPLARVGLQLPSSSTRYRLPCLQQAFEARLKADGVDAAKLPNRQHVRALIVTPAGVSLDWLGGGSACVRFSLPPSSYATMALRQLLRSPAGRVC